MQQLTLEINGMSCGHCVAAVKQALAEVPGVEVNNVSIGQAVVSYDPATTKLTTITDALGDIGYEAHETP
jgi:copper chaperone